MSRWQQLLTRAYPDGSYADSRPKLFRIPYLEGGISYFGLAQVFPKGRLQFLSDWLQNFINKHTATKSLQDFAAELRNDLHSIIPGSILQKNASGFHICGYNKDGLPDFWYLSNIGGMDASGYTNLQARYGEPSCDFLGRDALALGWDGTDPRSIGNKTYIYRNGDIRSHAVAFARLDEVLIGMSSFPDFKKTAGPEDWVRFKFEFVAYFYRKFANKKIIGTPIDVFSLTKALP